MRATGRRGELAVARGGPFGQHVPLNYNANGPRVLTEPIYTDVMLPTTTILGLSTGVAMSSHVNRLVLLLVNEMWASL